MRPLFIITLFVFSLISFGQIDKEKTILQKLCSKEFAGRGYVNNGVNLAADFIADEFSKAKALPAGEDGTYFHYFSLNVNTIPEKADVWIKDKSLTPGIHYLVESTSGSFKGELKLIPFDPLKLIDPDKKTLKLVDKFREGPSSSKSAILIDITSHTSRDTIQMMNEIASAFSKITPVVVRTDEKFMWHVGRNQTPYPLIRIQDSILGKSKSIRMEIENKYIPEFKTKNVIAKVKGKRSDSCFVFTAHYDHLGAMGSKAYFPGANDNASGTTMIISIADYFAKNQPEFDIYFIAFSGEEAGLVGSMEFVKDPTFDIKKIKFLMNLDIMGSGDEGITAVNGAVLKDDFERLKQLNKDKNLLNIVKPRGKTQNSDHFFFQEKGIKTFFIYTMGKNKAYHDIFDKAENLDLDKFKNLRTLFIDFIITYP